MKCDCPIKQGIKVLAFFILVTMLASCTNTPEQKEKGSLLVGSNNYHSWRYDKSGCVSRRVIDCQIDFSSGLALADFESWVIAFRTGGRKVKNYNQGFSLGNIGGSRALLVTQSDTRDPGGKRRTEAKVALIPVGDYKVSFDIFIESVPMNFDSTISQIKCGSGKPPINIKITNGGGVRVKSGGNHVLRDTAGYLTAG